MLRLRRPCGRRSVGNRSHFSPGRRAQTGIFRQRSGPSGFGKHQAFGFQLPAVPRGYGARPGNPHVVIGAIKDSVYRTNLILAETLGQPAAVTVSLYDGDGTRVSSFRRDLPPYGKSQISISDIAPVPTLLAGAVEILAEPGSAGAVVGLTTVIDGRSSDASTFLTRPLRNEGQSTSYAVASVVTSGTFRRCVEIRNNGTSAAHFTLQYHGSTGKLST